MNRFTMRCGALLLPLLLLLGVTARAAENTEEARLVTASQVLESSQKAVDQRIPSWLMERAWGVAVLPEVINVAAGVGGRRGHGVLSVRDANGRFGNPVFVTLTGGSVGFQFGAQASDIVLVFVTERSVENFRKGDFTLGVNASIAAGPLGRQGEAAAGVKAEVYAYSRSRGLFYSLAINGTALTPDRRANKRFYGHAVTPDEILSGAVKTTSPAASRFIGAIAATLPAGAPGATAADAHPTTPAAVSTPNSASGTATGSTAAGGTAPAPGDSGGAQTFPMEDKTPGSEPH